jgi:ATP-dependent exoDNAse (exonuclease V) alpha subunit
MNEEALKKLDGEEKYLVAKIIKDFPENLYPTESALRVKLGAQVMFVKNDTSADKNYFNGKIGVIHSIDEAHIEVLFTETGQVIKVKPETWENKRYALSKAGDKLDEFCSISHSAGLGHYDP